MFSHEENMMLTGVRPGTPLHEPLSRFWHPVARSEQLADRCTRKVRLLGEDFVIARRGAELLALQERCPHRQCSLTLARVEETGLRCIYHGWLIGADGTIKETPNERDSGGRRDLRARAPHVREAGGLIWLNIHEGEGGRAPFPELPWMSLPAEQVAIADVFTSSNWVQSLEGAIDSSHSSQLHSHDIRKRPSADAHPRIEVRDTDFGFIYGALRKPIQDPDSTVYVRTTAFAFPSFVAFSLAPEVSNVEMFVPVDEEHTHFFHVEYSITAPVDRKGFLAFMGLDPEHDIAHNGFLHISSLPNWGQDRTAMAEGRSFCGVKGINRQDIVVQESMGPIVDRTREHLGVADRAIVHFRRLLLECARGGAAAVASGMRYRSLQGREGLLPVEQDWTRIYAEGEINWRQSNASAA